MLALSRKKGESLIINNNIEITILEIKGDQIKIGIDAPKSVPIYRKEVYLQIQEENKNAMNLEGIDALKKLLK
ncbi:MAG: carbon storage regulator CsrA [Lachnospiraceae bacterium]|nr:carbon storage regulator CsrA [Lachnospiraceae bacterium]MCR5082258.1 carbon storage regulator CsrA [Parasporobacterium sp.]